MSGRFDTHGIVQEVKLVEVHLDNFFLGVVALEFDGYHPFDRLLHGALEESVTWRGVQQFGQLLGDGRSAAGAFVAKYDGLDYGAEQGTEVYAGMFFEASVLGGYQGVHHVLRNFIVVGIDTVAGAAEVAAHLDAVGGV